MSNRFEIRQILRVGVFGTSRLGFAIGHDRSIVDAMRELLQPFAEAADRFTQPFGIDGPDVNQPLDPARAQLPGRDRPDPPQRVDRQLAQKWFDT